MAAVAQGRNYVCISKAEEYNTMVTNMKDISFLKDDCKMLYDGRWDENKKAYHKLTVSRTCTL